MEESRIMDSRLLNGKPKVTVIQRFDRSVAIIRFGGNIIGWTNGLKNTIEFKNLEDMKHFIEEQGYEINVAHIHPGQIEKD